MTLGCVKPADFDKAGTTIMETIKSDEDICFLSINLTLNKILDRPGASILLET